MTEDYEGRSTFSCATTGRDRLGTVYIPFRLGDSPISLEGLLDTGSTWSVIGRSTAESLCGDLDLEPQTLVLKSWSGDVQGHLGRLAVCFVAEEGDDLYVDATWLVVSEDEWRRGPVLGWRGLLERVRFGVSPSSDADTGAFFFGQLA